VVINDDSDEFEIRPAEDRLPGLLFVGSQKRRPPRTGFTSTSDQTTETLRCSDYLLWAPREQTCVRASSRGWSSQTPMGTSSAYLGRASH
jgi:hypothetical protein